VIPVARIGQCRLSLNRLPDERLQVAAGDLALLRKIYAARERKACDTESNARHCGAGSRCIHLFGAPEMWLMSQELSKFESQGKDLHDVIILEKECCVSSRH
jgi:hypothetical protein